ncbi:hypothetical protein PF005_g25836 [Phytophthora fragariae]|uniref:Uncharacterized protein n=2 Tax=Phytophthora TaxID=4783 RepID=A0A6A3QC68_9STRA|nr:hypothetical protein PF003_g5789 [Phytophthora fragariae]KAE8973595.1 hypothetical protein PR002_g26155 [Phytophthora rubi]KAE8922750.1 hypothetical protein PF009_g26988 [Phytophthora fragariae]KAE8968959.1 hypothetical protein PF011_g26991 [Phytophthora fragariae]KAE8974592.1 hypothetical protein PR001_g25947 [Phytophthora rubi]
MLLAFALIKPLAIAATPPTSQFSLAPGPTRPTSCLLCVCPQSAFSIAARQVAARRLLAGSFRPPRAG